MAENTGTTHTGKERHDAHMAHVEHTMHVEHEHAEHIEHAETKHRLESEVRKFKLLSGALAVVVIILAVYSLYPIVTAGMRGPAAGQTLAGINNPLSSSELSVINNAPNSDFETAGEMMLNLSMPGEAINRSIGAYINTVYLMRQPQVKAFVVNGKPSVIYVGAISCIYCAENRWAMALALSRFGNFSALYKGYSSLKDGDAPTLFWAVENITSGGTSFSNYYSSNYINFFSAEYDSNISSGFSIPNGGYSYFIQSATGQNDKLAMEYMANISQFRGTPATLFGTAYNGGADASVFGIPNSTTQGSSLPPLSYMTHAGILGQFKNFDTAFSIQEYAAADVYVAQICRGINNTAPVCSLRSITAMEGIMNNGLA